MDANNKIRDTFGNRLRVRVSGILVENEKILMVKHRYLGKQGILWAPPGGGMKFGQSTGKNLKREFLEETGLEVSVEDFLFVNEYLESPLHAIELFFKVKRIKGKLITGFDPEMKGIDQIIESVEFMDQQDLEKIPGNQLHNIFLHERDPVKIHYLNGFYNFYKE